MSETIIVGRFEWDKEKENLNIKKHGISFEEILPMFDDPLFWEKEDFAHSSYTERERIRIISARISTKEEEKLYEKWCKQFYN